MALFQAENGKLLEPACLGSRNHGSLLVEAPAEPPIGDCRRGDDHREQRDWGERRHLARAMADAVASSRARP